MVLSAASISRHLSDLLSRPVKMDAVEMPSFSSGPLYACYDVQPYNEINVVKIDFALFAAFAATLLAFPASTVQPMIESRTLSDDLKDAGREIMNVLSPVVAEAGRPVFQGIFPKAAAYSNSADRIVQSYALCSLSVKASVNGFPPGFMSFF